MTVALIHFVSAVIVWKLALGVVRGKGSVAPLRRISNIGVRRRSPLEAEGSAAACASVRFDAKVLSFVRWICPCVSPLGQSSTFMA